MAYNKVKQSEPGIWQLDDGRWLVDIEPIPGRRVRRTKKTKVEALKIKNTILSKANNGDDFGKPKRDKRLLSDLVDKWFTLHGHTLKDGKLRYSKLKFIVADMGGPSMLEFNEAFYLAYRQKRQKAGLSDNTCNHDLSYLKAVFNALKKRGLVAANPLENVSKLKVESAEITFLSFDEIERLLNALEQSESPDGKTIAEICLSTGCRWSEAETLRRSQVGPDYIEFANTKSGLPRLVPINDKSLIDKIKARPNRGRLFKNAYGAISKALITADIELPRGQRSHVLRHSFAVHFMRDRGNILDLQKILGHETIDMTLRYAQFHPDYLQDAATRNPLAQMRRLKEKQQAA